MAINQSTKAVWPVLLEKKGAGESEIECFK